MILKKLPLAARVYTIANQYNVEQNKVHQIINSYITYCKDSLLSGHRVEIFGLITLMPNILVSDSNMTLAYECSKLDVCSTVSSYTVYCIVNEYINSLIEDVTNGKSVELRGLACINPIKDADGNIISFHSSISALLKEKLINYDAGVSSIRVYTHRYLKHYIKERSLA